jgi:hypothetical protein
MNFDFQEYQKLAVRSLKPETTLEMLALHLAEKVGAIAGVKYKALKIGADSELIEIWLTEELGWCLWCVAAITHRWNIEIDTLALGEHPGLVELKQAHRYQKLLLSCYAVLSINQKISDRKTAKRRLSSAAQDIVDFAKSCGLDPSAIASINLAKVAR